MKKIKIADKMFAHAKYSTDYQESKYIIWDRSNISIDEDLVFFTDNSLMYVNSRMKNKIAWILESPDMTKQSIQWVSTNNFRFDYVLTNYKPLLDRGENFLFCPTGGCWIKPSDQKIYNKSKMLSIIASNKRMTFGQKLRHEVVKMYKDIDIFGRAYNPIKYKLDALRDYRFSVTVENTNKDYYFSEKLIDCFMTGTVPIYFGPPSIGDFFNIKGILVFDSMGDLDKIINSLTEEMYNGMLPYIEENFEKAKEYLIAEDYIYEKIIIKF